MDVMQGLPSVEHRVIDLDWDEDPLRCPRDESLPPTDPHSVEAVNQRALERVRRAIEPELAEGWEPEGELWDAIELEKRERRVLLPTPGMPGPVWEEYCAAHVRLQRG